MSIHALYLSLRRNRQASCSGSQTALPEGPPPSPPESSSFFSLAMRLRLVGRLAAASSVLAGVPAREVSSSVGSSFIFGWLTLLRFGRREVVFEVGRCTLSWPYWFL